MRKVVVQIKFTPQVFTQSLFALQQCRAEAGFLLSI
jgi:hypothetical protein